MRRFKRLLPLLLALAIFTALAPAAMAAHCIRCTFAVGEPKDCVPAIQHGWEECEAVGDQCFLLNYCGFHEGGGPQALASEFTVASVERLDEPRTAANETLVAKVQLPAPATR